MLKKYLKRYIFVEIQADWGSNVFFAYSNLSQRVDKISFKGYIDIVPNNYEQQMCVCYTIGIVNQVFIDQNDLLHSSWKRQINEGVVRFLGMSDGIHIWNPYTVCGQITNPCETYEVVWNQIQKQQEMSGGSQGRVETQIYYGGKFRENGIRRQLQLIQYDTIRNVRSEYCDGETEIGDVTCFSISWNKQFVKKKIKSYIVVNERTMTY
ncbi:MAG: hypothetical protein EZS28_014644 [Streblomastix strix]|uniref:Uncharacterized protein n=1 Tax=Streblomastix strix TaxID=222440 RepID=A0A5J4W5W3_9EUKA|nr:MAG: hypothetical protein EZS28_014644 [Streblomastix strix]